MAPLRRWLNTSLLAQGVLVLPVALLSGWLLNRDAPPVAWILQSLAVTGAAVGTLAWRRRKDSREAGVAEGRVLSLDRRIRKGDVPHDPAERAELARLVAQRRRMMGRTRWGLPLVVGVVLVPSVLFALLGQWPAALGMLLFALAFIVFLLVARRRAFAQLARVEGALEDEA